jgi:hypothetical protein
LLSITSFISLNFNSCNNNNKKIVIKELIQFLLAVVISVAVVVVLVVAVTVVVVVVAVAAVVAVTAAVVVVVETAGGGGGCIGKKCHSFELIIWMHLQVSVHTFSELHFSYKTEITTAARMVRPVCRVMWKILVLICMAP